MNDSNERHAGVGVDPSGDSEREQRRLERDDDRKDFVRAVVTLMSAERSADGWCLSPQTVGLAIDNAQVAWEVLIARGYTR